MDDGAVVKVEVPAGPTEIPLDVILATVGRRPNSEAPRPTA